MKRLIVFENFESFLFSPTVHTFIRENEDKSDSIGVRKFEIYEWK